MYNYLIIENSLAFGHFRRLLLAAALLMKRPDRLFDFLHQDQSFGSGNVHSRRRRGCRHSRRSRSRSLVAAAVGSNRNRR